MAMKLAAEMKALAAITVPAEATQQEMYAATELRYYMSLMSSADFEIVHAPYEGRQIAIGKAAEAMIGADDGLGEDGFRIETLPEAVAIEGGKRGVIYGAYELLEALGCRFFTPTCEKVPSRTELTLEALNTRQVPALEYREHCYGYFGTHPRFAVKSRLNGNFSPIKEKFGGHMSYTGFVHTAETLVPTDEWRDTHPEYFALHNGERCTLKDRTQLCLSNPEVTEVAKKKVREILRANPETRIMSISQNDVNFSCQCEKCLAIDREEGSPSGTLLRFVNAIAEEMEPEYPDVIFDTLAYQYTRPVPKITKPRHNVCIRLCSIECCFAHTFEGCDHDFGVTLPDGTKTSFIKDLREWGAYHDRLYVWDYITCFAHYALPFPNWRTLQPNMQVLIKNHVKGVFEQANMAGGGGVDFNEMRAYIISKLLWNADCDVRKHIEEFSDYYYGAAGKYVREYIDALCDKAEKDNIHIRFNNSTDSPLYNDEMLNLLDSIMDKAEAAVQGDPIRLQRVGKARLAVRYVRIKNKRMLKDQMDPEEVTKFFTDWREYGMTQMEEAICMETSHRALMKKVWRGVEFYEYWTDEGGEEY